MTPEDKQWDRAVWTLDAAAAVIVASLCLMLCLLMGWRWFV
ncbi:MULTISPECIES: hypothetical protein [Methylobacterium]|uniref:Uncharacterized protein n=1 Tax=Methylobacterium thuringiense TaxID=1003091 RepID=A0ABQ4TNX4_9HYPH|nr:MULTISPECIES: hypothetical protein [Methylobacterium]GJE56696.1 hypothetical protein EKPJFOCH_3204 [Methylobacterium thuringiense]